MIQHVGLECHETWCAQIGVTDVQRAAVEAALDAFVTGGSSRLDHMSLEWFGCALMALERGEDTGSGMFAIDWNRPAQLQRIE